MSDDPSVDRAFEPSRIAPKELTIASADFDRLSFRCSSLFQQLETAKKEISHTKMWLRRQDLKISQLQRNLELAEAKLDERDLELTEVQAYAEELKSTLAERDSELDELRAALNPERAGIGNVSTDDSPGTAISGSKATALDLERTEGTGDAALPSGL